MKETQVSKRSHLTYLEQDLISKELSKLIINLHGNKYCYVTLQKHFFDKLCQILPHKVYYFMDIVPVITVELVVAS